MYIRDLSIGDWVFINGEPARVLRLTQIGHSIFKGLSGQMYCGIGGNISPLPITPEILEKNGISKTYESDEYAVYKGEGFNLTYYTELWEFERGRNRLMIRNVHQLQHALRLLGISKWIEL